MRRADVLQRIGLCLLTAVALSIAMRAWHPPFGLRSGDVLTHDAIARVPFAVSREIVADGGVEPRVVQFEAGQPLAHAGQSLTPEQIVVLRAEHEAAVAERSWAQMLFRGASVLAIVLALFGLCGLYFHYRRPRLAGDLKHLALLLAMVTATVVASGWVARGPWRAEIIPLLLFSQTMAIVYRREPALLLAGVTTLLIVLSLGEGVRAILVLMGITGAAVLQLGRIRNRSKLVAVAAFAAAAAFLLTIAAAAVDNQSIRLDLLRVAGLNVLWTFLAGFLMSGLLYFVERIFGVMTDISLLDEWADMSRPLMQELVQRAPGTYNHSIIVGSIAEAAADAIGAHGLLVRVAAYYHDIGKMLKPGYFIENQSPNDNRHEGLLPAMSTLVIVAHVKDGVDLARQHKLPDPLVELIEQHHGTTLVEYFYSRANEQREADPNGSEVPESAFRYPGPKPQTKEAGVLMLADAAESACRSLVDPAPARIDSIVREVAERRLHDGQFDESGLSLRELRTAEASVVKSLVANYHGRIKYPDQRTAS